MNIYELLTENGDIEDPVVSGDSQRRREAGRGGLGPPHGSPGALYSGPSLIFQRVDAFPDCSGKSAPACLAGRQKGGRREREKEKERGERERGKEGWAKSQPDAGLGCTCDSAFQNPTRSRTLCTWTRNVDPAESVPL